MLALTLVLLAATPEAGSSWTWSYDDARKFKLESGPRGGKLEDNEHLQKAELVIAVTELGEDGPRKLTVKVARGTSYLAGRSWKVESNYGEAVLTEVSPPKKLNDLQRAMSQVMGKDPGGELLALRRLMGTLLSPDPIVAAASSGAPCDEATRAKVGQAAGKVVSKHTVPTDTEFTVKDVVVTCAKPPGKYAVRFTTSYTVRDQPMNFPWKGTVEVPAGAWRALLQVSSASVNEVQTGGKPIRVRGQIALRSILKKKHK